MVDKELELKITKAKEEGFYGTMYGKPSFEDEVIWIDSVYAQLWSDYSLVYVWGWPGPDYTRYMPQDYGITWALTKEDFINKL